MFIDASPLVGVMRDLNVREDKVQQVIDALNRGETSLSDGSFSDARIPPSSFGGNPVGHELGTHHNMAQEVANATVQGLGQDLGRFRDGVRQALRLVDDADQGSASDLNRRREVAENLNAVWQNSEGDRANRDARARHENLSYEGSDL